MNFIQRAIKNVTRKWSKSVLIAITFFVIGNFVILGLGVSNAAEQAKIKTRKNMRASISYEVDYETWSKYVEGLSDEEKTKAWSSSETTITDSEIKEVMTDSRIKTLNALSVVQGYSTIDSVPVGNENNKNGGSVTYSTDGDSMQKEYIEPQFMIKGNIIPDMIELSDGIFKIEEGGRFYTQEDIDNKNKVILVTKEMAELNNLRIGDMLHLDLMSKSDIQYYTGITEDMIGADFEIIGIYTTTEEVDPNSDEFDWMSPYMSPKNVILAPATALDAIQFELRLKIWDSTAAENPNDSDLSDPANRPTEETSKYRSSIVFLLNDPLEVDQFVADYTAKNIQPYRLFNANNEMFKTISKPLDTMSLYATFIVWLVIFNAVIIISLVTALTLKTREYEIGVLLSMGVSKFKVVSQMFLELAIVAVLAFSLAAVSGSLLAKQVGNSFLNFQISSSDINGEDQDDYGYIDLWGSSNYFSDVSLDDLTSNYEVSINPMIILSIYLAGIGIVFISILVPSIMIMRFNPKRILMNQN